eukprot:TRINITY_DN15980_c0_g2_i1.p1 TRINITY_DN15980_c0_g2~~TRINITY_DN15980_c0_g2_i1.p1  ORF type:complete len:241 (-),score=47.35 TRINITY_DN15980_c0_g2_i1:56-724(-)
MTIVRSFDTNKPGLVVSDIMGGVIGGSLSQGVLEIGHEIEIRPGLVRKDEKGNFRCTPIRSKVKSLFAEKNELQYAVPGGLIGVGTTLDPFLTKADRLVGQVAGIPGTLPPVLEEMEICFTLLQRLVGTDNSSSFASSSSAKKAAAKVKLLSKGETVMLNVGSTSVKGIVKAVRGDLAKVRLDIPVCASEQDKLTISRRVDSHWRLIGRGTIMVGQEVPQQT